MPSSPGVFGIRSLLVRALTALGGIAAVLAIGTAAYELNLPWLLLATLIIAIAYALWPMVARWRAILRRYPDIAAELEMSNEQVAELTDQVRQAGTQLEAVRRQGVEEGEARVVGAVLSASTDPPELVSRVWVDDRLVLIAKRLPEGRPVENHARFGLVTMGGSLVGSVEVYEADEDDRFYLRCAERLDEKYWKALEGEPRHEVGPPRDVKLERYNLTLSRSSNGEEMT